MKPRYVVVIILFLLIAPVVAFDIFQEKHKSQWGFRDFYSAAQQAGYEHDQYAGTDPAKAATADQTSLENYLKAEELAAKEPDSSPDKWYFISKINGEKFQIYTRQGKTAEAQKATALMASAGAKYQELTKNDTSFNFDCLIATATFNSPLAPQVQQLRDFREHTIYSTKSGTQFMIAFNAWYYSFSPAVADFINDHPMTKAPLRVVLTPLLGILTLAQLSYSAVSFNPDFGVIVTGLVAGTLIGAFYAFPVLSVLILALRKFRPVTLTPVIVMLPGFCAFAGMVLLALGGLLSADVILLAGSVLFIPGLVFLTGLVLTWVCLDRPFLWQMPANSR